MLEILKTPGFWIALAAVAILTVGMGVLKKWLKRIATKWDKKKQKD